jgi:hypothetical protein
LWINDFAEEVVKMLHVSSEQAYFMGCVACRFGKDLESNPFEEYSDAWKKYREGWFHAEEYPYSFQVSNDAYV